MARRMAAALLSALVVAALTGCPGNKTDSADDDAGLVASAPPAEEAPTAEEETEAATASAAEAEPGELSEAAKAAYESGLASLAETEDGAGEDLEAWEKALEDAIDSFTECIAEAPDFADGYRGRGEALLRRGLAFIMEDEELAADAETDLENATGDFDSALELDDANAEAYIGRGMARQAMSDYNGAIEDFDAALEVDPGNEAAKSARASCLDDQEMWEGEN